jgi:hypothetical protein
MSRESQWPVRAGHIVGSANHTLVSTLRAWLDCAGLPKFCFDPHLVRGKSVLK